MQVGIFCSSPAAHSTHTHRTFASERGDYACVPYSYVNTLYTNLSTAQHTVTWVQHSTTCTACCGAITGGHNRQGRQNTHSTCITKSCYGCGPPFTDVHVLYRASFSPTLNPRSLLQPVTSQAGPGRSLSLSKMPGCMQVNRQSSHNSTQTHDGPMVCDRQSEAAHAPQGRANSAQTPKQPATEPPSNHLAASNHRRHSPRQPAVVHSAPSIPQHLCNWELIIGSHSDRTPSGHMAAPATVKMNTWQPATTDAPHPDSRL